MQADLGHEYLFRTSNFTVPYIKNCVFFLHKKTCFYISISYSETVDMKRIKSKSKDMKNMIDHGHEIMDRKSWT